MILLRVFKGNPLLRGNVRMVLMTRIFWSTSGLALYVYAITILVQNGYNDYFGIPRNYIESSLVANITFFWATVVSPLGKLLISNWFMYALIAICLIIFYSSLHRFFKRSLVVFVTVVALIGVYKAYPLGMKLAKGNQSFYEFSEACSPLATSTENYKYIGPVTFEDKVVMVPVNASGTLRSGFRVIDLTTTTCLLERRSEPVVVSN